jgi:hypothetical protein
VLLNVLNEAARDGDSWVEMFTAEESHDLPISGMTPQVDCRRWVGPGFVAPPRAAVHFDRPPPGRAYGTGEAWVAGELEWRGEEFPGTWLCTAQALNGSGDVIGSGSAVVTRNYVIRQEEDSVPVEIGIDLSANRGRVDRGGYDCEMVDPERDL